MLVHLILFFTIFLFVFKDGMKQGQNNNLNLLHPPTRHRRRRRRQVRKGNQNANVPIKKPNFLCLEIQTLHFRNWRVEPRVVAPRAQIELKRATMTRLTMQKVVGVGDSRRPHNAVERH
jgi:hypothetical protein